MRLLLLVFLIGITATNSGNAERPEDSLTRLRKEILRQEKDGPDRWKAVSAFREACKSGDDATWPELLKLFEELFDSQTKASAFPALADLWLRLNISDIPAPGPLSPLPRTVPDRVTELSPELRHCWELFVMSGPPVASLSYGNPPATISYQANRETYWQRVEDMLNRRNGPWVEDLRAYGWGGWCGTGSDSFRTPHSFVLLLAHLAEKNQDAARKAALQINTSKYGAPGTGVALFLKSSFVSPAQIILGGLVALETWDQAAYGIAQDRRNALLALLLAVEEESIFPALVNLADATGESAWASYIRAFKTQITTGKRREGNGGIIPGVWISGSGSSRDFANVKPFVSDPAVEAMMLGWFDRIAASDMDASTGYELARAFEKIKRPETIPALKRLLGHRSRRTAEEAHKTLDFLGEKLELPPPPPELRFRIMVNGAALSNHRVHVTIPRREGGSRGQTVVTNAEGLLVVPETLFVRDSEPDVTIYLQAQKVSSPGDPLFQVKTKMPDAFDAVHELEVETRSFTLHLPSHRFPEKHMHIRMWGQSPHEVHWSPAEFALLAAREVIFQHVAPGEYRLQIFLPGYAYWSGSIDTRSQSSFLPPLQPGRDVSVEVLPPEGWHANQVIAEVWRGKEKIGNEHWVFKTGMFRGLPFGSYVLRIPDAEEHRRLRRIVPLTGEFSAVEIPFEINEQSPPIVKLPTVDLR